MRLVLAALICAVAWSGPAAAQAPAAKTPPGKYAADALQAKPVYDVYEPSQRLRTRRQQCMQDEEPMGAYCAKKCQPGYQMTINDRYARCRTVEPLPPGSLPSPMRTETGTQPESPHLAKPQTRQPGA
jgi:hypothetical protein